MLRQPKFTMLRAKIAAFPYRFFQGVSILIELLSRILIRNRSDVHHPEVRRAYGVLCGAVGIALNIILFIAKYFAGLLTSSIAITADAFNNLSDAGSSVITLIGFKISGKRDDDEHPFGHGRVEYIAGLIVSLAIIMMGFDLAKTSISKIIAPESVEFRLISVVILAISIVVKLYMCYYNRKISQKINSVAMKATATDSLSDVFATSAVLAAMLIAHFTGWNIDAWVGVLVSLMILWAGYCAARDTISPLLGNPPDPEFVRQVDTIVRSYKGIWGVHDLMVHDYGAGRIMISLHAEVPADGDLMHLHDLIDTIERRLKAELRCEAVIHMDPISTNNSLVAETRARILELLQMNMNPQISIHDFRMVAGPTHTNLIFDAVIPHSCKESEIQLRAKIRQLVNDMDENYFAIVTIDHPFSLMDTQ